MLDQFGIKSRHTQSYTPKLEDRAWKAIFLSKAEGVPIEQKFENLFKDTTKCGQIDNSACYTIKNVKSKPWIMTLFGQKILMTINKSFLLKIAMRDKHI